MPGEPLTILLASPRGTCAGVERAILIVEEALRRYGAPVYVRHQIVHNRHVVSNLSAKGAVFVEEIDEVPDDRPVVFSAHGVPRSVHAAAMARKLLVVDAVCPLVGKVHREVLAHFAAGRHVLLIGHAGHPEVLGTLGQMPPDAIQLVGPADEVDTLSVPAGQGLAYATQTTLAVEDAARVIDRLTARFPDIVGPVKEDICYATSNRQKAVRAIAPRVDLFLVMGSANSSNSNRLVEVARTAGSPEARLIDHPDELDLASLDHVRTLGLSAGASAPAALVNGLIDRLRGSRDVRVEEVTVASESVTFRLPDMPDGLSGPA